MADFSALKTSIQNYIKQNGNEEITGNLIQQILLSMVSTLGDSAINDLVTALNAEIANRGNADTELGGRITTLQGVVNGIKANVENGYVYAGIATPSTTPVSGKVFYLALTAGTYTNFGATVVPQGINILKYNGSAWSLDSFLGLDDAPTQGSSNLVKSGGVLDSIIKDGSAFDLSAYNSGTTYADLSAALTALNALPAAYKKGGMSFKFVLTSDNNYVQFRCIANEFTVDTKYWILCKGGKLIENPQFIAVWLDGAKKIFLAAEEDGNIFFGAGVPKQVIEYINKKIAELSLDEYEDIVTFLGTLISGDKTLAELLNEKVDKVEGKSLIDEVVANKLYFIENPEFIKVELDANGRIVKAIMNDGIEFFGVGVNIANVVKKYAINNPEWYQVKMGKNRKIFEGTRYDGTKEYKAPIILDNATIKNLNLGNVDFNSGIPQQIKEYVDNENVKLPAKLADNESVMQEMRLFKSIICVGDSVTEGHLFWRNKAGAQVREYSYPAQLAKMLPEMTITNAGRSGQSIKGWCDTDFSNYDFSDYDICIIELGYNADPNGALSPTYDTDVAPYGDNYNNYADTAMGNYCRLIKKIEAENPYIFIVLVISSNFNEDRRNGVLQIAQRMHYPYIDLMDKTLFPKNYADANMPFSSSDGGHSSPWGYLIKASYIRKGIGMAIGEYYTRAINCLIGQNDWIWKVTAVINDESLGSVSPSYQEFLFFYVSPENFVCTPNQNAQFDGWYIGDVLVSSNSSFKFDPSIVQSLRYQLPQAVTLTARVSQI